MGNRLRVLLVDDDEDEYILTQRLLSDRSYAAGGGLHSGFELDWVSTYEAALQAFEGGFYDVYLVDYRLGERDGLELVREAAQLGNAAPIIVMTGQGNYNVDVEAMKAGATDYLVKGNLTAPLLERAIRYAIERKRAETAIREHAQRAELLAKLSQVFAEAGLDYETVLDTIAKKTAVLVGDACVIRVLSDNNDWLDAVAYYHPEGDILASLREMLMNSRQRTNEGLAGDALALNQPVLIHRAGDSDQTEQMESGYGPWLGKALLQSSLVIPMRARNQVIGTFGVLSFRPGRVYSEADKVFFQGLADRAAMAIENARLYDLEEKRAAETAALGKATAALLTTIDLESLLKEILDAAQSAIPSADRGLLHLVAPETGFLQVRAASGFQDERIKKAVLPRKKDFFAKAVEEHRPLIIYDTKKDPNYHTDSLDGELKKIRSAIVAPLTLKDDVLGVLSLSAERPRAFQEGDLSLLVSFAATTTAALHNAMLHAEVQKLALTDGLTQIYNRRGFFELGKREVEVSHRFNHPLSAIMIDLDNFKRVNDTYGHASGDQVLRILAGRLRSSIREVDIIGRYGGDEFVVLLPETDLFTASAIAERLRLHIEERIDLMLPNGKGATISVTASLGVSNVVRDTQNLDGLIERADKAAYHAKGKGRNRVEVA